MEAKISNRIGKCINTGICSKANSEEKQVIINPLAEFICSECEQALQEIPGSENVERSSYSKNKKIMLIVVTSLIAILAVYFGIMNLTKDISSNVINTGMKAITESGSGDKKNSTFPEKLKPVESTGVIFKDSNNAKVIDKGTKTPAVLVDKNKLTQGGKHVQGTVETNKGIDASMSTPDNDRQTGKTDRRKNIESSEDSLMTLMFKNSDRYVGETKNGLMHGAGAYYFGSRQVIWNDPQKRVAEAGYVLKGNWSEGKFSNGKLYDKNNKFIETIIIGQLK